MSANTVGDTVGVPKPQQPCKAQGPTPPPLFPYNRRVTRRQILPCTSRTLPARPPYQPHYSTVPASEHHRIASHRRPAHPNPSSGPVEARPSPTHRTLRTHALYTKYFVSRIWGSVPDTRPGSGIPHSPRHATPHPTSRVAHPARLQRGALAPLHVLHPPSRVRPCPLLRRCGEGPSVRDSWAECYSVPRTDGQIAGAWGGVRNRKRR